MALLPCLNINLPFMFIYKPDAICKATMFEPPPPPPPLKDLGEGPPVLLLYFFPKNTGYINLSTPPCNMPSVVVSRTEKILPSIIRVPLPFFPFTVFSISMTHQGRVILVNTCPIDNLLMIFYVLMK